MYWTVRIMEVKNWAGGDKSRIPQKSPRLDTTLGCLISEKVALKIKPT